MPSKCARTRRLNGSARSPAAARPARGRCFNVMQPKPGESFAVFGVGAVGLSALMAAKIAGCDPIIAVDVHEHRLALARELGATHTIDHGDCGAVVDRLRAITGTGVRYSIETSALPAVFREAIEALMPGGTCVLLGSARKGSEVAFEMPFLQEGRVVRGVVQGNSFPKDFIPRLVDLIMENKFPIEKMIKFYDFADINLAAEESSAGIAIKPVLRMPTGSEQKQPQTKDIPTWKRCRSLGCRDPR